MSDFQFIGKILTTAMIIVSFSVLIVYLVAGSVRLYESDGSEQIAN